MNESKFPVERQCLKNIMASVCIDAAPQLLLLRDDQTRHRESQGGTTPYISMSDRYTINTERRERENLMIEGLIAERGITAIDDSDVNHRGTV